MAAERATPSIPTGDRRTGKGRGHPRRRGDNMRTSSMPKKPLRPDFIEPFDAAIQLLYGSSTDWREYRRLVEVAHAAGDPRATYAMATWHLHGHPDLGITRRPKTALPLLVSAARHFGFAALDLAISYELGRLVRRDEARAFRLYKRAARLGCVQARFEIGRCYFWGIGTAKNDRLARRYHRAAEALGYSDVPPTPSRPKRAANGQRG